MMLPTRVRVLVANEAVDFRKSYDALCGVVRDRLQEDPLSPTLFVFHNKRRDQVKILWWDKNGFAIWMKRLERGAFRFVFSPDRSCAISQNDLALLLEGVTVMQRAV